MLLISINHNLDPTDIGFLLGLGYNSVFYDDFVKSYKIFPTSIKKVNTAKVETSASNAPSSDQFSSQSVTGLEKHRIPFFDGLLTHATDSGFKEIFIFPSNAQNQLVICNSNEAKTDSIKLNMIHNDRDGWFTQNTRIALGASWISLGLNSRTQKNTLTLYIMQCVPTYPHSSSLTNITTDLAQIVPGLKLVCCTTENFQLFFKDKVVKGARKLGSVNLEREAKRLKVKHEEQEEGEMVDDGSIPNTNTNPKLQNAYLTWKPYKEPGRGFVYPPNSLGAILEKPNSLNSRPDFHGRQ